MIRTLMVPLDGSPHAEQALPLAIAMARHAGARMHLIAVRPSLPLTAESPESRYLERLAPQLEPELPDRITFSVVTHELGPLDTEPAPRASVAGVLAHHAADPDVDMVVMTTHGRGLLRRAWLGSVADSFMRIAPKPVIVIRPRDDGFAAAAAADRGINHIVIPLDGSAHAERAIAAAMHVGRPFGARYTLVRAVSPMVWTLGPEAIRTDMATSASLERGSILEYLENVADPLRAIGARVATSIIDSGSPAAAILEFSREHAADLVALATSGIGGTSRLLLGSVADKVVRDSDVPVLVCNVHHMAMPETATAAVEAFTAD